MTIIDLDTAADHIKQACEDTPEGRSPFFFLVGAGISYPPISLASHIIEDCRAKAHQYGRTQDPPGSSSLDKYSYWFHLAFAQPIQRQRYLRKLIQGKPISAANFRLAHLLLGKTISNIVVTTNFDDFLSRTLTLFGVSHIVCDHPRTVERIDPESDDIQIVHVHGTYWFYDCCNLREEITHRSEASSQTSTTMASLLDRILSNRSPLVIGYGGWEGDVFMAALKRRLQSPLPYNLYWFCHTRKDMELMPEWLRENSHVYTVVPPREESQPKESILRIDQRSGGEERDESLLLGESKGAVGTEMRTPSQPAQQVFDKLIRSFSLDAPELTRDPLGFYAKSLKNSLLLEDGTTLTGETDLYSIRSVIGRIEAAKQAEADREILESPLERVRDAMRRSSYREAISHAQSIDYNNLESPELRELVEATWTASLGLDDGSQEMLEGYDLVVTLGKLLDQRGDSASQQFSAMALINKGIVLGQLNRSEEELDTYDQVVARFGEAAEPALREHVAAALINKGIALGQLNRSEEELDAYDQVVARFGEAAELTIQAHVAGALINKGVGLSQLNRSEEALDVYDQVITRFGESAELAARENVARALINKGLAHSQLNQSEETLAAYDQVITRFGESAEPILQEGVARALLNKGHKLLQLNRNEDALAVSDQIIARFGESTELAIRERVAAALISKGLALSQLRHTEEALTTYEQVIARFGEAAEPALQKQVARALTNKGLKLVQLNRSEEALAVYNQVIARFGNTTDPALRERVASALTNKGIALRQLNRSEEALSTYDQVIIQFGEDSDVAMREQVARALLNKGVALSQLNHSEEALNAYDQLIARFGEAAEPVLQECVARALLNKGLKLAQLNRSEDALAVYDQIIARFGEATAPAIQKLVEIALQNKKVGHFPSNDDT